MLVAAAVVACAPPKVPPADNVPNETKAPPVVELPVTTPTPFGLTGNQAFDRAGLDSVEREIRKLVRAEPCRDVADCRTAPIGVRACGGPRDYIVVCATTTDTVALFRMLDDLERLERAFNQRYGVSSTCEFRVAPGLALVGPSCRGVR